MRLIELPEARRLALGPAFREAIAAGRALLAQEPDSLDVRYRVPLLAGSPGKITVTPVWDRDYVLSRCHEKHNGITLATPEAEAFKRAARAAMQAEFPKMSPTLLVQRHVAVLTRMARDALPIWSERGTDPPLEVESAAMRRDVATIGATIPAFRSQIVFANAGTASAHDRLQAAAMRPKLCPDTVWLIDRNAHSVETAFVRRYDDCAVLLFRMTNGNLSTYPELVVPLPADPQDQSCRGSSATEIGRTSP